MLTKKTPQELYQNRNQVPENNHLYAPTKNADENEKRDFYFFLQAATNTVPKTQHPFNYRDLNAKVV